VTITVNGQTREFDASCRLGHVIDAEVSERRGVAVAVDGEMVPRADWDDTELEDGARVEVVAAVQGG
jgi:sulfur carrier protein